MVRAADGTGSEKALSPEPAWQVPTDWSRDGKYILYERGDPGSAHVWALPLMPGGRPFPVVQTQSWDRDGHFSPDGKWVIFTSRESGADQIYITPFPGPGPKFQVSRSTGGSGARWSADGKWVCYWNGAQNVLLKVSVSTGGPSPVIGDEQSFVHGAAYKNPFSDVDYSLSRDGRVLVNQIGEQSSRLTLVTNWQAEQGR
jgi:Tol biopolymer transport system component